MWAGGGNVGPFLCLAEHLRAAGHSVRAVATAGLGPRLAGAGVDLVGTPEGWLPGAADVVRAADEHPPDVVVVDYMLTDALGGAELVGRPTVALVHTLYRALLADGSPHPMGMAGPVEALNPARVAAGLAPLASLGDLLDARRPGARRRTAIARRPGRGARQRRVRRPPARRAGPRRRVGPARRHRPARRPLPRDRGRPGGRGAGAAPSRGRAGRPPRAGPRDAAGLRRPRHAGRRPRQRRRCRATSATPPCCRTPTCS